MHTYFVYKNNCDDWSQSSLCAQRNAGDFLTYLCCYFSLSSYRLAITVLHCLLHCKSVLIWLAVRLNPIEVANSEWNKDVYKERSNPLSRRSLPVDSCCHLPTQKWAVWEKGLANSGQQSSIRTVSCHKCSSWTRGYSKNVVKRKNGIQSNV